MRGSDLCLQVVHFGLRLPFVFCFFPISSAFYDIPFASASKALFLYSVTVGSNAPYFTAVHLYYTIIYPRARNSSRTLTTHHQ
ncbi:hypothetical protein IWX47DRAFT_881482 [Phyllosticta citricarpa]